MALEELTVILQNRAGCWLLTVLALNSSLFRNLILRYSYVSLGELICIGLLTFSPTSCMLTRVLTALSQARRGPTHPVTVMFYTPRGRAAIRNHGHSTRHGRLVRLCRHLSKNINCEAER